MKLKKMTATFGKLQGQTLTLKDGLNIIEAPNEAGKSTWSAFLRAMLYGIDTKQRDKKGTIAEKNRYQPWSGGTMEGSIEASWNGNDITLRRTSRGSTPMSQFQAVYTGTETPVPGLTGDNVGQMLTGVGREVFERSAFVGQSAITVTGSAELERRISAIVSSGQEDVSYSETEQRLRDWKNRRQSNQKNGLIPRLEEEIATVSATLDRLERSNRQAGDARAQIRVLQAEQTELENQAQAHRALAAAQLRGHYDEAKTELDAARSAMDSVQQELQRRGTPPEQQKLRNMQGELSYLNTLDANIKQARQEIERAEVPELHIDHPVFSDRKPEDVWEKARADKAAVCAKGMSTALWTSCLVLFLLLSAGCLAGALLLLLLPLLAGSVIFLAVALVWILRRHRASSRIKAILDAYGAADASDIEEQAKAYVSQWESIESARTEAAVRAVSLERLEAEREELTERLIATVRAFAPEVTDLYGVSAAISLALNLAEKESAARLRLESAQKVLHAITAQGVPEMPCQVPEQPPELSEHQVAARLGAVQVELQRLNQTLAMAQGEMNTLGDSATLQAQLAQLEDARRCRREEYDALVLAMAGLEQANAQLQQRMSPALNQRAGELLAQLTGGVYDQVSLTREFDALAGRHGDVTPRKLLSLSRGTADQLYLAVRLAVCDLVLPGEDPAVLVLDDALVNFDDERLNLALDLLRELATQRQILLFTCQSRERLWLQGASDVHVIRLQS